VSRAMEETTNGAIGLSPLQQSLGAHCIEIFNE